jgi:23S rRNA-/tRNA-specific pseudouridylate synthase
VTDPGRPQPARHTLRVEADSDVRLDSFVASRLELSRTQAATLIANGKVLVGGRREKAAYRPAAGDVIDVEIPPPPGREVIPESIPLDIVFEDEHLLAVNKAAGMVVHPAPGNWSGTLVNALLGRGATCPTRRRRSAPASSTGSTRTRPGCCSSRRPTGRTGSSAPRSPPGR